MWDVLLNYGYNMFIVVVFLVACSLFKKSFNVRKKIKGFNDFLSDQFQSSQNTTNDKQWIHQINNYFKEDNQHPLAPAWRHFISHAQRSAELPDIYDYINRDVIEHQLGERKKIESIPGFLISGGILGTFIGLVYGLMGLDIGEALQSSITTLLAGVSIAFVSSLIGISLSIVWSSLDRFYFAPKLEQEADTLMNLFSSIFPQESDDSYLKQLLQLQKEQVDSFKTLVTDTLIPDLIEGLKEAMHQSVVPHLERNAEAMDKMIERSAEQQMESLKGMSKEFLENLNKSTGEYFAQLGETLAKAIEWSQQVHDKASSLIDRIVENAETQFKLSEQLQVLSESFDEYTESLSRFQFEMNSTINELQDVGNHLSSLQSQAAASFAATMERQEELNTLQQQIRITMQEQLEMMENRISALKGHWDSTDQRFAMLNQNLSQSMEQFAQHMYQGLDRTFDQFDKNLRQAVQLLESSVVGIDDAVSELPQFVEQFQINLKQLNEKFEAIVQKV
jgi:ABC-type transporter Mla subunit MlaD